MRLPAGLRHRRRMLVGQLWMRGYSVRAIAELIQETALQEHKLRGAEKTTYVTVWKDVKACQADWMERSFENLDKKRADQIARLEDVIHQAWIDFANRDVKLRPRYLQIVLDAEEKIAKISGTLAPVKVTGGEGEPLIPPSLIFHMADGTVYKPPINGHGDPAEIGVDGNGDKPETA